MDKWLRNTTVVRIVALALGILLWVVVHLDEQPKTAPETKLVTEPVSNAMVTPVNLDETQYSLQAIDPKEVTLKLRGSRSALNRLNPESLKIQVDLKGVDEGEHLLPLKAAGYPTDVDVEIYPSHATVNLEKKTRKEMPVTIDLTGNPSKGFKEGIPLVNPSRVHVAGPESILKQVDSVRADVNIEGSQSAVVKEAKLSAYNKNGKELDVSMSPSIVNVEVPISSPFKTMPLQIRLTGELPDGLSIAGFRQSVDQVTVYGPQSVLDSLEIYDGITIDLSQLKEDKQFSFNVPLKEKITQADPAQVEVEVDVEPSETKVLKQVPIVMSGTSGAYTTKIVTPAGGKIDLAVEGAPSVLKKLKPGDVQAVVDVSNLPLGKHTLQLVVNLPPYVRVSSSMSLKVDVEVTNGDEPVNTTPDPDPVTEPDPDPVTPPAKDPENADPGENGQTNSPQL